MKSKPQRFTLLALKLALTVAALAYVFYKVDMGQVRFYIASSKFSYLLLAFVSLNVAVIISAMRLRVYLKEENIPVPKFYSFLVFYVGMFFNTVFPGGIGGDGYMVLHLKRKFDCSALQMVRILLTTRANGLFFLNIILFIGLWFSEYAKIFPHLKELIILLFVLQFPVYMLAAKYILKENLKTFTQAGFFSILSQAFFILAAYLCFTAIGIEHNFLEYLCLYIASNIIAVLPITPGGAGIREMIFFKGALLAGLAPQMAVAGSLIYFIIYFAVSLSGLVIYLSGIKIDSLNE